jgi:cellulose synthase/poly-beta-1,6-N-acetylglucosamine synthase-like glycosyltransferase
MLAAYLVCFFLPVSVYVFFGRSDPIVLTLVHYTVATAYAFTAVMILLEVKAAWGRRSAPIAAEAVLAKVPLVTLIVSAYLPNEQDIVAETILQLSTRMRVPTYRLQIILAYNTPNPLAVEQALEAFRRINASFIPLRVEGSRSKAENVRAALEVAEGEMTVLLDADHHLLPDAIERAYRWLERGYDVVQGRCVVRRQGDSFVSRWIAVEFEQIYAVSHAGRSIGYDTAIFGGSNGYWRTSVLKAISMDPSMLTEDIDSTLRAMLAGYRFIHDRSIISSELAPPTFSAWWHQRIRWSQGWFQVTLRHQPRIWKSDRLSRKQKFYWTYLLSWRELFPFLSLQVLALITAGVLLGRINWFGDVYLTATFILTFASGPASTIAAYRVALWRTKERLRWWFVAHAVFNLVYTVLKNSVAMVAQMRQIFGRGHDWVVTPRKLTAERIPAQNEARKVRVTIEEASEPVATANADQILARGLAGLEVED